MKDKNYMIIKVQKKTSDKNQYPFMMKTLKKLGMEGIFLNIIKAIFEKSIANRILWRNSWIHTLIAF